MRTSLRQSRAKSSRLIPVVNRTSPIGGDSIRPHDDRCGILVSMYAHARFLGCPNCGLCHIPRRAVASCRSHTKPSYIESHTAERPHGAVNKRSSRYDPSTEKSRLLAALEQTRRFCCMAEETLPYTRAPGGYAAMEAIKQSIDDWAECEMGHRGYFWGRPPSAGCKDS